MNGFEAFQQAEIRVGQIIEVHDFLEARKPAYKLTINFGEGIGIRKSSAQIVHYYSKEVLLNKLVLCLVNVNPRQIGPFISEVLTLGVPDDRGNVVLITPDKTVPIGGRLF
jgi:tRNA-binding protein